MQKVLHETCQQYVARRLSEGWSIVRQSGSHLILSSPDGNILKPVDLLNDVETLRPNAAGDETGIVRKFPDTGEENWEDVNEAVADDDGSFVSYPLGAPAHLETQRDLYNLPASSGMGVINKITVYDRVYGGPPGLTNHLIAIKTHGNVYQVYKGESTVGWVTFNEIWANNPFTHNPWTWDEIDALQIGVKLVKNHINSGILCTQVYVEVDYTPPPPSPNPPTNVQATDGVHPDKVVITWTKSLGATGYQVYRDGLALGWLGDVATYDDIEAGSPSITPGNSIASDGAFTDKVALSLSGTVTNNGTTHTYKVRAKNAAGSESLDSATDTGYRAPGPLTYQWQRSAADSNAAYSDILGATAANYDDFGAPEEGSGRYYRCRLNAVGATQQYSAPDRGYRHWEPPTPPVTTEYQKRALVVGGVDVGPANPLPVTSGEALDQGVATNGGLTTLEDNTKGWQVDIWAHSIVAVEIGGIEYHREVDSNTADTLDFTLHPLPMPVVAGCPYTIRGVEPAGYEEDTDTGITTNAWADALDWATREMSDKTILLTNTDPANSLDYRVYTRAYYTGQNFLEVAAATLAPAAQARIALNNHYARVLVQVIDTAPPAHADYEINWIGRKF